MGDSVARFEFQLDDSYARTAVKRMHRARPRRTIALGVRLLGAVLTWGVAVLYLSHERWPVGLLLLLGGAFLALSVPIEHQRMARRAKKGPFFGRVLQVHLSDEGYSMKADISDTLATWDSVTRAVRFEDGHLLYMGPDTAIWLPEGALAEGSPAEVIGLLMEKIPNYAGIPDRSET